MQHVDEVSREEAERLFAAGVLYTEEERVARRRQIEVM